MTSPAAIAKATPLRVVPPLEGVDLAGAERAAAEFLAALGLASSGATADTPRRMARAYAEMLTPRSFDLTTFPNDEHYDELVLARAIPVQSVCEHHMLPFLGVAHVGYLPGRRILGDAARGPPLPRGVPRPHHLQPGDVRRPSWLTRSAT